MQENPIESTMQKERILNERKGNLVHGRSRVLTQEEEKNKLGARSRNWTQEVETAQEEETVCKKKKLDGRRRNLAQEEETGRKKKKLDGRSRNLAQEEETGRQQL